MGLFSWFQKYSEEEMVKIADIKSDSIEGWSEALAKSASLRRVVLNSPYTVFNESKLEHSEKKKLVFTAAISELFMQTLVGSNKPELSVSNDTLQFVGYSSVDEFLTSLSPYLGK